MIKHTKNTGSLEFTGFRYLQYCKVVEIWSHAERNAQNPVFRRYFEMKHALNGVSYAADVYAPRKV